MTHQINPSTKITFYPDNSLVIEQRQSDQFVWVTLSRLDLQTLLSSISDNVVAHERASLDSGDSSKAQLEHKSGMHLRTKLHKEFQSEGEWYRGEVYENEEGNLTYAGYVRLGAYWRPVTCFEEATHSPRILDSVCMSLLAEARKDYELPLNPVPGSESQF